MSKPSPKARKPMNAARKSSPVARPVPDFDRPYDEWTIEDRTALWDNRRVLVACNNFHGTTVTQAAESFATFMFEASDLINAGRIVVRQTTSYITALARSKVAWEAIQPGGGYTHLFQFDADMTVSLDHIMRLLARNVDVVSGTYFMRGVKVGRGRDPHPFPCVATRDGEYIRREEIASAAEADKLIPCTWLGGGCLLVTVEALRAIGTPAFTFDWEIYGDRIYQAGEDSTFSTRALRNGYIPFMDPTVRPDHFAVIRSNFGLSDSNGVVFHTPTL